MEGTAIWQRLGERGYPGSLSSVYRFLHQLTPPAPDLTVRVERAPGSEAQVDFGYAGYLLDEATGQRRKAWAFVMTLAYSRHQYVEFVHDQALPTWITLHRHAFTFFGGYMRNCQGPAADRRAARCAGRRRVPGAGGDSEESPPAPGCKRPAATWHSCDGPTSAAESPSTASA